MPTFHQPPWLRALAALFVAALLASACGGPGSPSPVPTLGPSSPGATPPETSAGSLVGTADFLEVYVNGEYNGTTKSHASDVVWELDPTSSLRPPDAEQTDVVSVYFAVSGRVDWSYTDVVQGSFTSTCTVTGSGSEALPDGGGSEWDREAYLMINHSQQPATYSIWSSFDGLPKSTCLESEGFGFIGEWVKSDPFADPLVSGTDGALVLAGSYVLDSSLGAITLTSTYTWDFTSAP